MNTALIVEDDADQAHLAAQLVRLRNFHPVVAPTGHDALSAASRLDPEVVLLDLMLPDIDGFDVCRRLRSDARTRTLPIVMVTALGDEANRRHGFRVGANAYLTKPYEAEHLFGAIARAQAWRHRLSSERVQGEIHVELNSEPRFLQEVNEFFTSLYRDTPLTNEQIMQLRQAVMEMGQNAIEWGNRHHIDKLVRVTFRICDDRIEIVVRDEGEGFDLGALPHAATPEDPLAHMDVREKLGLRDGGFGLLISRGMLDELRHNEAGNEVTLVKRFEARAEAGAAPA